jgi:triacylglycerol esterase/lipase EstA (alpha/beta hydrolase family)
MARFQVACVSALAVVATAIWAATAAAEPAADTWAGAPAPAAEVPMLPGPPQTDHGAAMRYVKQHPGSAPAGVNDFGCVPSAAHPRPVILAHGSDSNVYSDWAGLAPLLVAAGYCVFAPNYGGKPGSVNFGSEDMNIGARQFAEFVDRVLAATDADKVDLVGFSQGATIARYYVNRLDGADKVNQWIGMASPTYGGIFYGLVPIVQAIPPLQALARLVTSTAVLQQMQGSAFLTALNSGGDTVPGVRYTTIGTRVDEMIQPYTNVALRSPGARNILIQDLCPTDLTGHFNMPYDRFAQQLVLDSLDPTTARPPDCVPVPLGAGILSVILAAHT